MECADTYRTFFKPGEVTEVRGLGLKGNGPWDGWTSGVVAGYFNNAEAFGRAAEVLDKRKARGVYFTLNPLHRDLLARANNRLVTGRQGELTGDKHVLTLRWLYIDIDREGTVKGISSTAEELSEILNVRQHIADWLIDQGVPSKAVVPAMSGNGGHLLCRLPDLDNTETNVKLVRNILKALDAKFSAETLKVDVSTYNPARICKLYGTTARKGDSTNERPHRLSYIELDL